MTAIRIIAPFILSCIRYIQTLVHMDGQSKRFVAWMLACVMPAVFSRALKTTMLHWKLRFRVIAPLSRTHSHYEAWLNRQKRFQKMACLSPRLTRLASSHSQYSRFGTWQVRINQQHYWKVSENAQLLSPRFFSWCWWALFNFDSTPTTGKINLWKLIHQLIMQERK